MISLSSTYLCKLSIIWFEYISIANFYSWFIQQKLMNVKILWAKILFIELFQEH